MNIDTIELEAIYAKLPSLPHALQRVAFALGDKCFEIDKIGKRLDVRPHTVAVNLQRIYENLGLGNIVQLGGVMYWNHLSKNPKQRHVPEPPLAELLTPQQLDIAALIVEGYQNINIHAILGISENAVKDEISAILRILRLSHRIEIAFRVLREHFLSMQQPHSPAPS